MDKTDKELVEEFIDGSEIAFNKIVRKYQQKIYWHANRMLGNHDDADELTQEVLIVLYNKLVTFNFQSGLYTWIYKITSTRAINFIRKRNIKKFFSFESESDIPEKSSFDIAKSIEDREKLELITKMLQKLPVRQREVFILRNFEGLSYNEISEITGKSVGGLKASYFHALNKITELTNE
ncbi:MAG: RNA polymerase sigma factor [Ignavibacteriae bacterium HGW-Ignavibacteriae-2]|jgi:RNA polymerase sigma-70 factor (ECF subfamily)|nr:RNA polymerase sigma factor [Bacteroidota bacterium]PKL89660.1 MAG: RNA polymerase sigma factor [Ignavibacteriae bacterium HGW-Ignavibacteriae-2]